MILVTLPADESDVPPVVGAIQVAFRRPLQREGGRRGQTGGEPEGWFSCTMLLLPFLSWQVFDCGLHVCSGISNCLV